MKIYVASKFENVAPVRAMQDALIAQGHVITYDWTREDPTWTREVMALKDFEGVMQAEAIVLIAYPNTAGALTELGIALARGIQVIVIDAWGNGHRDNIFYYLPGVIHLKTLEEAVHMLRPVG